MKLVSSKQMQEMDRRTITEFGVPGDALMDRAGFAVARIVEHLADTSGRQGAPVLLFAGRGNNGGDAFVAARYLKEWGTDVCVYLTGERGCVRGDALTHLNRLRPLDVKVEELLTPDACNDLAQSGWDCGIVVDGVLGTGITGPARGVAAGAINCMNTFGRDCPVVAIDIPSGLNADSGETSGDSVRADVTVTMGFPKTGLAAQGAVDYVGMVEVVDIGIPGFLADGIESDMDLITPTDLRGLFARRPRQAHKGTFGHVLLVGGSPGYAGAIALAAGAALRSGVGLVSVLVPQTVAGVVAGVVPEAMVHGGKCTDTGSLEYSCLEDWRARFDDFDAVLVGPGMTPHADTRRLVVEMLAIGGAPLVLDADALNAVSGEPGLLAAASRPLIITPHPGEAGRLLDCPAAEIQADRCRFASELVRMCDAVAVLKGAGTLVAASGRPVSINMCGNPGMACGGMGDVLGGLLAGLLAQGIAPYDAARAAVYLHGLAGDEEAWHGSQAGLTAGDVVEAIPHAFKRITAR